MNASNRRGWLVPALLLVALAALSPATAEAQSGQTNLTLTMPNIIVLHYFSTVAVDIDTATLQAYLDYADVTSADEGNGTGSNNFTVDLDITGGTGLTDPTGDIAALMLTLQNAWAVRALGPNGNTTQVAVTNSASLAHATSGSITINSSEVQTGATGWGANAAFAPPGLVNAQAGDVRLSLDLTNATLSGDYAGTYTISVTTGL